MYRFYSKRIKALVVNAGYCVMWFVLSMYFILVFVAVFVLGLIF